jgi:hypothetical protein
VQDEIIMIDKCNEYAINAQVKIEGYQEKL